LEIKLTRSIGDTTIRVNLNSTNDLFTIPLQGTVTALTIDPNNYLLNGVGTITNDPLLSAKSISQDKLKLSPNPLKSGNKLQFSQNISARVSIKDVSGKIVVEKTLMNENSIQTSSLNSGIYFIEFNFENQRREVHKISIVE
jgi:hypothetical protein